MLLVKSKDKPGCNTVKITDFGLALHVYRSKDGFLKPGGYAGTKQYMAPEIFRIDLYPEFEDENGDEIGFDPYKVVSTRNKITAKFQINS